MELWKHAYQALLYTPSDLVLLLDPAGHIDFANDTFLSLSGLKAEDVLGRHLDQVLPPELADKRMAVVAEVAGTGKSVRFEDQGVSEWFDNSVYPITDERGEIQKIAVIARNITRRKEIEEELAWSNKTLIEVERALREREDQLRAVVNQAPVVLFVLGSDGTIRMIEGQRMSALHYQAETLIGRNIREIANQFPTATVMIDRALSGAAFTQIYTSFNNLVFEISFIPRHDSSGQLKDVYGIAVDVTEKIAALRSLEEHRDRLNSLVEARTRELAEANRTLQAEVEMRGRAEQELRRQAGHAQALSRAAAHANAATDVPSIVRAICIEAKRVLPDYSLAAFELFDSDSDRSVVVQIDGQAVDLHDRGRLFSRDYYEMLLERMGAPMIIPDARRLPKSSLDGPINRLKVRTIISIPLYTDGELLGCFYVASIDRMHLPDADELKLLQGLADQAQLALQNLNLIARLTVSESRLRKLSENLVKIQEAERTGLARELHDEIGQMLTSLELNLDYLARLTRVQIQPDHFTEALVNNRSQVRRLLTRVREMSLDLRPPMLERLGLVRALLDHFARFSQQTNIQVEFKQLNLPERLDPHIEINVFRIIQEGLTNIARHAEVDQAKVLMWSVSNRLGVKIEDNGRGFDPKELENTRSASGLTGMRERAASCNGILIIEAAPGHGVSLTLEIPLDLRMALDADAHPHEF